MSKFRLYVWNKDVLRDWSSGCAVAAARSVEEARKTIIDCAKASAEDYARERLARDISGDPDMVIDLPAAHYEWGGA